MAATSTEPFAATSVNQFLILTESSHFFGDLEDIGESMTYRFTDSATGTTATTRIDFRTDANKIADNRGNSWLHVGAEGGSEQMVKGFITKGGKDVDIDIRNRDDMTPLMVAVSQGRQKVIELLIENGADINACIRTSTAPQKSELAKRWGPGFDSFFISRTEHYVGVTALTIAAKNDAIYILRLLLKLEARVAADMGAPDPLEYILGIANVETVRTLIEAGCNPHLVTQIGQNALHLAIANHHPEVVRMLVTDYHVDINKKDNEEYTPLGRLFRYQSVLLSGQAVVASQEEFLLELMRFLLEHGAEVDLWILSEACQRNKYKIMIALLELGKFALGPTTTPENNTFLLAFTNKLIPTAGYGYGPHPTDVLPIIRLALAKGAVINPKIHKNLDSYFQRCIRGQVYVHHETFGQLQQLVREHAPPSTCEIS